MNEEQFNDLLKRYQAGKASSTDIKLIERWLEFRGSQNIYGELSDEEVSAIKKNIQEGISRQLGEGSKKDRSRIVRWRIYRAAAVVLLLVAAGLLVWKFDPGTWGDENLAVAQSTGGIEKVILDDGSIVWLKGESSLTYPEEFAGDERRVELEGEALFEVAKSYTKPSFWERFKGMEAQRKSFVVKSGSIQTRVLGTSFNVKSNSEETEVYVLTGKVKVQIDEGNGLELLPNERSVYERRDGELKKYGEVKASIDSIRQFASFEEITKGTEYNMYFENVSLGMIAQRISQKFDVKVDVADAMESCLIRADFTDQSLENTLELIAETMNGRYKIEDGNAYLYGPGCE